MGFIYVIKNSINDKCYIGQTRNSIEHRWNEHKKQANTRNQALYLAMKKYDIKNFYVNEIEEISNELLDEQEKFWIKELNTISPYGYNMTYGGDSNPMHIPEIAQKVSLMLIGDKNPTKRPEVREKIRIAATGRRASKETKLKMSKNNGRYWLGKKLPEEQVRHYTENHWARGKTGKLNPDSKPVEQIDKDTGEVIRIFDSAKEGAQWASDNIRKGCHASNISQCISGRQKTAFGYKWSFVKDV